MYGNNRQPPYWLVSSRTVPSDTLKCSTGRDKSPVQIEPIDSIAQSLDYSCSPSEKPWTVVQNIPTCRAGTSESRVPVANKAVHTKPGGEDRGQVVAACDGAGRGSGRHSANERVGVCHRWARRERNHTERAVKACESTAPRSDA
jgi:hypothetical protein